MSSMTLKKQLGIILVVIVFLFFFADKEEYGASSSFYSYLKNEINKLLKNTNISK